MITKLADKWHNDIALAVHKNPELICANQLRAALPTWTRIGDEDVLEDPLVLYGERGSISYSSDQDLFPDAPLSGPWLIHCGYTHWRPLCDLDYPPEQDDE